MDRVETYRSIVKQVLEDRKAEAGEEAGVRIEIIADDAGGHYQLVRVGWRETRRIFQVIVHVDFVAGKVVVEKEGTDFTLMDDLITGGISPSDIVLGFHPPAHRKYTDFAVS